MLVVFYTPQPADASSGTIVASVEAGLPSILADGRPFVVVTERRDDYDVTSKVVSGKVVGK